MREGARDTATLDPGVNTDLRQLIEAVHRAGFSGLPLALVGVGQGGDFAALATRAI